MSHSTTSSTVQLYTEKKNNESDEVVQLVLYFIKLECKDKRRSCNQELKTHTENLQPRKYLLMSELEALGNFFK